MSIPVYHLPKQGEHTITVEPLHLIEGCERAPEDVTAVVERLGSHVKVCYVSRDMPEQFGTRFQGMSLDHTLANLRGSVERCMSALAEAVAFTYGATYRQDA